MVHFTTAQQHHQFHPKPLDHYHEKMMIIPGQLHRHSIAAASARKAGYRARKAHTFEQIGHHNRRKYGAKIVEWLDQYGMSETQLKIKLLSLMEAHETVFQKLKRAVRQEDLPRGCRVMATSGTVITTKDGEVYGDGETLLEIEVLALETQRRALDMALKMKGLYAAEKVEHSGAIVTPIQLTDEDRAIARKLIDQAAQKLICDRREVVLQLGPGAPQVPPQRAIGKADSFMVN